MSLEHREEPDPFFSLHANLNLPPNVNLGEIINELEPQDQNFIDGNHKVSTSIWIKVWIGLTIGLVVLPAIVIPNS